MQIGKIIFGFGENWEDYSSRLREADYYRALGSLSRLVGELENKSFLDIGSGSGIFSIAASGLGATKVLGVDIDPKCVQVALNNLERISVWDNNVKKKNVEFKKASILADDLPKGTFDVVYSWGALHHTGDMWGSFDKVITLVKENGILAVSIYNKHFTSPFWKQIKYLYNFGPKSGKMVLFYFVFLLKFLGVLFTQVRNPLKKERGMKFYYDVRDWAGGYPYEYAAVDEVTGFFEKRGFKTLKVNRTKGFTGCNEFVFVGGEKIGRP